MKTKSILFLLVISFYFSCSNDPDDFITGPHQNTQGSVFVTIKDHKGLPVDDALITFGLLSGTTDESGTYFFTRAMLSGDDYLTVTKNGYFKGSRRFYSNGGATQFLEIMLLPYEEIVSYKSSNGASLYIDNKSRLIFPNNAVTRQDGSAYSGDVHIMAQLIYGDDEHLSSKMPGALVGRDETNAEVVLGSFGMLAVELQGDNGEALNIAPGKTVEIEMAVADEQLSTAPATIPLWHYDEVKGMWVEDGQAVLEGNKYVGSVSHFSWWNLDIPLEYVRWESSFVYTDSRPVQHIEVCLSVQTLGMKACAFTDAGGVVSGLVPANEMIRLTILNDCGTTAFSEDIGPLTGDITMDPREIAIHGPEYATISGTALQCDGSPVKSGFVRLHTPLSHYVFPITGNSGHFEGGYTYCAGSVTILYVYDETNGLVSAPKTFNFERNLNIGNVVACNQQDEFIRYQIKGFSQEYYYSEIGRTLLGTENVEIESLDSIGVKGRFGFVFSGRTSGEYSASGAYGNQINLQNGQVAYINSMTVNVTEFGPAGEFIRGTFSGKINKGGNGAGGHAPSDFSGSFAVRNE